MGWQTPHQIQMLFILQDVNSCCVKPLVLGAAPPPGSPGLNDTNHCLLSTYGGPEVVLFPLYPLKLSLQRSDGIATTIIIPILQMRKLKPRNFQQPRVTQLVVETLTLVFVTPESPHLPTGPSCSPRCYALGTDNVNKQEHWALALALSLHVTSCVTSPGLYLPVCGMWCDQSSLHWTLGSGRLWRKSVIRTIFSHVELDPDTVSSSPWS